MIIISAITDAPGQFEADLTVSLIKILRVGGFPPPKTDGATKSPKQIMNAIAVLIMSPIRQEGTMTRTMLLSRPAPRFHPASMRVKSILVNETNKRSVISGKAKVRYPMNVAIGVLSITTGPMPSWLRPAFTNPSLANIICQE